VSVQLDRRPADSPSPADTSPSAAAGLLAYVPAGLRSSCTDTGTAGHFPASISGYTDSLTCATGPGSEADYYQYASTSDVENAYAHIWWGTSGVPQGGGCASGSIGEVGRWSAGGATLGGIACPENTLDGLALIWDDQNTNILAVVKADYATPSNIYLWWQSNGASIDGSSQSATSS
jgi:hypothetical protein